MKTSFITKIGTGLKTFGAKSLFKLKKASPEICLVGGIVCIVGGTILAVRAGMKAKDILDTAHDKIDSLKADAEDGIISEETAIEEIHAIKRQATFEIIKYGAPVVCAIGGGIVLVGTAKGIVDQRYGKLLGAYNALEASFREYRNQHEQQIIDGTQRQIVAAAQEANNGQPLTQEQIMEINQKVIESVHDRDPYAFWFSAETSSEWHPHGPSNLQTILATEVWGTNMLRARGHLFLNDVLDHLGMDKVPWGQFVGWLRGAEESDSYVDILSDDYREILDMDDDVCKKNILLNFNCDGLIWDKI